MYRELIGKLIEGHNWARLQEPCPEKEIKKAGFSLDMSRGDNVDFMKG